MANQVTLSAEEVSAPPSGPWPLVAGAVGLAGLGVSGALGAASPESLTRFYFSYLVAFLFFLSIALGGLFFVLVQMITRAGWSVTVRRLAEHVMGTLPLFAVLFLPVAFGLHQLFHWSHEDAVAHDPILQHKAAYLNAGFFYARAAFYLVCWALLAWFFRSRSLAQDASGDPAITRRLQTLSAPGLVIFALTVTFAAFDWVMSLDPHWYSTIFGVYVFAGCVISICAVVSLLGLWLQRGGSLSAVITTEHYHDLGKLMFAFTVFWAYIAFSQFMLIWYANIPEETLWYMHRLEHGWKPVTLALAAGHFVIPFFVFLLRDVKRKGVTLAAGALWMLAMHYLDLYWLVMPVHQSEHFGLHLLDLTTLVGVGGLFLAALLFLLRGRPLVPVKDPRLAESLAFENM